MKPLHILDRKIASLVARIPERFEGILVVVTNIGGFWFVTVSLTTIALIAYTLGNDSIFPSLLTIVLLTPLAEILKLLTRRRRPKTLFVEHMKIKTYSFPSSHAYTSALAAGYLTALGYIYLPSYESSIIAAGFVLFVSVVGVSRVYLGAHFPSDVLAGWALASVVLAVAI